MITGVVLHLR